MKRPSNLQASGSNILRRASQNPAHASNEGLPQLKLSETQLQQPRPVYGRNKQVQQREELTTKVISDRFKTYTFDKSFEYIHLDTRILRSIFLGENQAFQDCLFLINQYNEEIEQVKKTQQEFKNGPWKMRFYSHLYNLLKEVIFTRDRIVQKLFVKEVHDWATQQLEALESDQQEIRPFEGDPSFLFSFIQSGLDPAANPEAAANAAKAKRTQSASSRNRARSITDNKQKTVTFTQNNFLDESSVMPMKNLLLDESTRDLTRLDTSNQHSPEKDPSVAGSSSNFKVSAILTTAGIRPRMKQPSEYIAESLRDYKTAARTNHPEYEPPGIRLKEFKRRVLSFDDPSKFMRKIQTEPDEVNEFAGVTYPKPFTFEDMKRLKEEEIALSLAEDMARQQAEAAALGQPATAMVIQDAEQQVAGAAVAADGTAVAPGEPNEDGEEGAKDVGDIVEEKPPEEVKAPLQPNVKNFTQDSYGKETFVRNLNKKFDVRSEYVVYEPTEDTREMRMERKWLEGRQKELKEKRENEEMIALTKDWSLAKGRIEKEINRKIDSNIYGSRFRECEYRFAKRTQDEMRALDKDTKEAGRKQNALQDILQIEEKAKRIELKQRDREERRREREQNRQKKKKLRGDSDSDKENDTRDNDSYDEELDGVFDPKDPKFAKFKKLHAQYASTARRELKSVDFAASLPKIAKQQHNPELFPFKDTELDARRQKIEMVKRMHGNFIGVSASSNDQTVAAAATGGVAGSTVGIVRDDDQDDNEGKLRKTQQELGMKSRSLSVYSRDVMQKMRPFSAIFEAADAATVYNEQLAEIHEVKNRLTKYKFAVPYKKLCDAMLVPEGLTDEADMQLLPEPGYGLVRNPFMKEKKKKKKKKKRS